MPAMTDAPAPGRLTTWMQRTVRRVQGAKRLLPWLSLAAGVVSAFLMERSPRSSVLVVGAALAGWVYVFLLALVTPEEGDGKGERFARFLVTWAAQTLAQQCLFFVLPFYVLSSSFVLGHGLFLLVFIGVCAGTLWDPFYDGLAQSMPARVGLQVFVAFVSIAAVLPVLGVPGWLSLVLASTVSALGLPALVAVSSPKEKRGVRAGLALVLSVGGFVALAFVGAPAVLPPAPLRLMDGGLGTGMEEHELVGQADAFAQTPLFCASAVSAPRGLSDGLVHVWRHDGKVTDRIPLTIRGGRDAGFRTYSKKERLAPGKISCTVETGSGQVLGRFSAVLSSPAAAPSDSPSSPGG